MKNRKYIVGDCFVNFSRHANVLSVTKFRALDFSLDEVYSCEYVLGQGVSLTELNSIKINQPSLYKLIKNPGVLHKASSISHKQKIENCHISHPEKISESEYLMDIAIDPECAELSDHITGEHINGIILIEAARQAGIAVVEEYFLSKTEKFYFILKKINTEFHNFLFPLPIKMQCQILSFNKKKNVEIEVESEATLYHDEAQTAATVRASFSVYPKSLMEHLESEIANSVVNPLEILS